MSETPSSLGFEAAIALDPVQRFAAWTSMLSLVSAKEAGRRAGATGLEPALYPHNPPTNGAVEALAEGRLTSPSAS